MQKLKPAEEMSARERQQLGAVFARALLEGDHTLSLPEFAVTPRLRLRQSCVLSG